MDGTALAGGLAVGFILSTLMWFMIVPDNADNVIESIPNVTIKESLKEVILQEQPVDKKTQILSNTLIIENISYKIQKISKSPEIIQNATVFGQTPEEARTDGTFLILTLEMKNIGKKTESIPNVPENWLLKDSRDRIYELGVSNIPTENPCLNLQIPPGLTSIYDLGYEVPDESSLSYDLQISPDIGCKPGENSTSTDILDVSNIDNTSDLTNLGEDGTVSVSIVNTQKQSIENDTESSDTESSDTESSDTESSDTESNLS